MRRGFDGGGQEVVIVGCGGGGEGAMGMGMGLETYGWSGGEREGDGGMVLYVWE